MAFEPKVLTTLDDLATLGLEIQPRYAGYTHKLESLLAERHLTASDLAKLTGMSRQNISAILSYRVAPSVVVALKIATILNYPVEKLFLLSEDAWVVKAKVNDRSLYIDHTNLTIIDSTERNRLEPKKAKPMMVNLLTKELKSRADLTNDDLQSGDWRPRFEPLVKRLTPIITG